jgi:hypothetical protein
VAVDVIIDPSNGQIYWNDNQNTAQSIAISGNATDKINFVGYSGFFAGTAGTAPADPVTRVTINDSASGTLVPGSNAYELGSDTLRWAVSATSLNASGAITLSYSPVTGVNTNHTLRITSVPFAEASGAVVEMGATTAFDNSTANFFSGSANGTYLAIRSASTFTGDYLNFGKQDGTSTTFSVSSNGNVTVKTSNQYGFVVNDNANGNKFVVDTNNTRIGVGKPADYPLDVRHTTANTYTVASVIDIETLSSGTTAAGFGGGLLFSNKNAAGATVLSNQIEGILSEVGVSYKGSISFRTNSSGSNTLNERIRVNYNSLLLYPYESTGTYELRFNALTGANYVGFKAPNTISSSVIWTLPSADGTASTTTFLASNGSGVLSFPTDVTLASGVLSSTVLRSSRQIASGGGILKLALPSSGSTLSTGVIIEVFNDSIRFYEEGGNARGAFLNLASCSNTAATNLLGSGTGTVTSVAAGTGLTGGTITTTGTIAIDTAVVPTLTATTNAFSSGNTTGSTTSSSFALTANSLTSGTGAYFASNNITSGKLVDIVLSGTAGNPSAVARYGLSVAVSGTSANTTSYGIYANTTTSGSSSTNIAGAFLSSGGTLNVPLRLGSASGYVNFFINTDGTGITLSPTATGTPFFTLAGYTSTIPEFRLCTDGGGTGVNYIGLKAPLSLATSKVWTLPSTDGSATSTSLSLLATNNSGVLSFPANIKYDSTSQTLSATVLRSSNSIANEGGEIQLALPSSGSALTTSVTIDVYQDRLRFFETGSNARGAYIDLTACSNSAGTNLLSGGSGGSGTVNSGASGALAYYPSLGTVVDDAGALIYATTGTNLTVTASAIGVIPLAVTGITGQTAAIFKAILNTTDVFVINNAGNISTGTWNGSAIGVGYGGTGQTSYTNGQLLIGNTTGNTLAKATLTPGSGVDIANGAGSITIRQKRPLYLTFCSGFTPVASGVDSVVLRIPDSPADGSTSLSYNVRELFIRVETPSAGTTSIQVEYYTGTSAFTATNMMSAALSITGASTYEASTTSFSQTTLASGNKVRLNFTALNSTHANFFVQLLLEEA